MWVSSVLIHKHNGEEVCEGPNSQVILEEYLQSRNWNLFAGEEVLGPAPLGHFRSLGAHIHLCSWTCSQPERLLTHHFYFFTPHVTRMLVG